jgi:predicted O-methyltransferase YrrM
LRRAAATTSTDDVLDAVYAAGDEPLELGPFQVRSEITAFVSLVSEEQPRRVLEIGTWRGGTLYLLAWASGPGARLLSLDVRRLGPLHRLLIGRIATRGRTVVLRSADSHAPETRAQVAAFFGGDALDLLFIDGDHSYEGVREDYELFSPLVRPGGLIAFHDIVDGDEVRVGGVPRFWREVRDSLEEPVEFVESWSQGGFGIGVGRRRT